MVVSGDIIGAPRWTNDEQSSTTFTLEKYESLRRLRSGCSCINLPMHAISLANASFITDPVAFVSDYNSQQTQGKCNTWDSLYAYQCRAHPSLDYCEELWCYVNESTCSGAMPSAYFNSAAHFSYGACKDQDVSNSWTKSHPRNCIIMDVPIGSVNVVGHGVCRVDNGIVNVDIDRANTADTVLFSNNIWQAPSPSIYENGLSIKSTSPSNVISQGYSQ